MKSLKLMIFGLVLALAGVGVVTISLFAAKVDNYVVPILASVFLAAGVVVTAVGLFMKDCKGGDAKKEDTKDKQ